MFLLCSCIALPAAGRTFTASCLWPPSSHCGYRVSAASAQELAGSLINGLWSLPFQVNSVRLFLVWFRGLSIKGIVVIITIGFCYNIAQCISECRSSCLSLSEDDSEQVRYVSVSNFPPEIQNCPSNIRETAGPNRLSATVSWETPTATDREDGTARCAAALCLCFSLSLSLSPSLPLTHACARTQ